MRFFPTLEVRNRITQVAFPDVHAVALAESCLITDKPSRLIAWQDHLLDSPMLLFWVFQKWKTTTRCNNRFSIDADEFESQLTSILEANARHLVRDHGKPLSSVQRIAVHAFVDHQSFFAIRNKDDNPFGLKLLERVAILEYLEGLMVTADAGHPQAHLTETEARILGSEVECSLDCDSIVRQYTETDFQHYQGREQILAGWELELPVFRLGFGELDSKLERLESLEQQFETEVEKAKVGAVQQLAYGASHEVNNPLANISTRAQALLRDESDPKRRQRLMTIDAQAFRAHDMISNLMTFAKPRRPVIDRIQLHPVVEKAIQSLGSMAEDCDVEIENDVAPSIYFDADAEQTQEILFSLIQNAIEAIRQSGRIVIRASYAGDQSPILIEVLDSGPGMSPEVRRHIFDPFFSGREAGRGLGFGMPKVWRLMELHDGSVRISEKQGMTCIELRFPAQSKAISGQESQRETA